MNYKTWLARTIPWAALAAPGVALAQLSLSGTDKPGLVPEQFRDFKVVILNSFNIVIIVAGIGFVVLLLYGGVRYLTSLGNEDATKNARQIMLDAAIGLAIVAVAWAVGNYVLQLLGINLSGQLDQPNANIN